MTSPFACAAAASMGHRGNPGHPEVQAAIEAAITTIVASGKAPAR